MRYEQLVYVECDDCRGSGRRGRCTSDIPGADGCLSCTLDDLGMDNLFFALCAFGIESQWKRKVCSTCEGSGELLRNL